VERLIQRGADVNKENKYGLTPLINYDAIGNEAICTMLIAQVLIYIKIINMAKQH